MRSGIYKIYWTEGYFYYGQSMDIPKRKSIHFARLKSQSHENNKLQKVFNKYGVPKFEVVGYYASELLNEKEQHLLSLHFRNRKCCNLSPIATGGGHKKTDAEKKAISNRRKGKLLSDRHKESISNGLVNAYSEGRKKYPDLNGNKNPFYGKFHSEEYKKWASESRIGTMQGGNNPNAKIIINLETGIFYSHSSEAADTMGISRSSLCKKLTGVNKNNTSFVRV